MDGKLRLAIQRMVGRYPLHGAVVSGWNPIEDATISTMCIGLEGASVRLRYSPDFIEPLTLDELIGVLVHEVHHVVFGHIWAKPSQFRNQRALAIGCEVCANEYIREPLPGHPVLLKDYADLPPDEDFIQRYHRLKQMATDTIKTLDDHGGWEEIQENESLAKVVLGTAVAKALPVD